MFIEKYQPYTSLLVTYNGEVITRNNLLTLPSIIKGEYKINLDAIGADDNDERTNLPFTRNDITWWLVDVERNLLTKEINVGDDAGTKFTIDDSGTVSIISTAFTASENEELNVMCVLGKPNSLNEPEFDYDTIPNGGTAMLFASGGSGEGTTFPTFKQGDDLIGYTCDLTYSQTYAVMQSAGVGNPFVTIPCVLSGREWCIAIYRENDEEVRSTFRNVPTTVNYGFWVERAKSPLLYYADNDNIYLPAGNQ